MSPGFITLATGAAYFGTALICVVAAWRASREQSSLYASRQDFLTWSLAALVVVLLGLVRQFDVLGSGVAELRTYAKIGQWYSDRRHYQREFLEALAGVMSLGGIICLWFLRQNSRFSKLGLVTLFFLVAFVVGRAASFHQIDILLGHRYLGATTNALVELGALFLISVASLGSVSHFRTP